MILLAIIVVFSLSAWIITMSKLPKILSKREPSIRWISAFLILFLLAGSSFSWFLWSDYWTFGTKTLVGKYNVPESPEEFTGRIYMDESGKYFVINENMWDILHPTYRTYLPTEEIKEYLDAYNFVANTDIFNLGNDTKAN